MRTYLVAILLSALIALLGGLSASARAQGVMIGRQIDWWKADESMVTFLCLPDERPAWCADAEAGNRPPPPPVPPPPPARRGAPPPPPPPPPPKSVSDEDWQQLMAEMSQRIAGPPDLLAMERRGFEDRDPLAFEVLGYTYATGKGPKRDYATAYQYYGLALVGGRTDVRTNLDELWRFLSEPERGFVRFRFERAFPRP